jgi:hypothetical protein
VSLEHTVLFASGMHIFGYWHAPFPQSESVAHVVGIELSMCGKNVIATPTPSEAGACKKASSASRTLAHFVFPEAVTKFIDPDESTRKKTSRGAWVAVAVTVGHGLGTGSPVRAPHAAT